MEDYEADETAGLPVGMKRGILSEEKLYNLLMAYEDLMQWFWDMGRKAQ